MLAVNSVPARAGCKRNWARPKFGHNLVRRRHKIGHSLEREWPKFGHNQARERNAVWAQFCGHKSASILQAFLHRLTENTKTAITFPKNKIICFSKLIFVLINFFFLNYNTFHWHFINVLFIFCRRFLLTFRSCFASLSRWSFVGVLPMFRWRFVHRWRFIDIPQVSYEVSIEVTSCPEDRSQWRRKFDIYAIGLTEKLTVNLDLICECECEKPAQEVRLTTFTPDLADTMTPSRNCVEKTHKIYHLTSFYAAKLLRFAENRTSDRW